MNINSLKIRRQLKYELLGNLEPDKNMNSLAARIQIRICTLWQLGENINSLAITSKIYGCSGKASCLTCRRSERLQRLPTSRSPLSL